MKTRLPLALLLYAVTTFSACFSTRVCAADARCAIMVAWTPEKASSANAAIMAYLGAPVPPPAELDPKYNSDGLVTACKAACAKLGFELQKLVVEDTEFPFLVYGVIRGIHDFQSMPATLRALPGYAYGGSVTGRKNGMTYFSLNLVPPDQFPPGQREAIQRRLPIRLQILQTTGSDPTP